MDNTSLLLEQLRSIDKNKRYAACEELRVASFINEEAVLALKKTLHDPDPDVVDAATRALAIHFIDINNGLSSTDGEINNIGQEYLPPQETEKKPGFIGDQVNSQPSSDNQTESSKPEMKKCPFCAEEIKYEAIVCRYCGRDMPKSQEGKVSFSDSVTEHHLVTIELDQKDCLELINILGTYGKNNGKDWELWASQINQKIQSALDNSHWEFKISITLDDRNWNEINKIVQRSCNELGGEWLQWSQKIGQIIIRAYQKPKELPPSPEKRPNTVSTKPQCPNCRSFNTVRHKTHLIKWGWIKFIPGVVLSELFVPAFLAVWGVIDWIKAAKTPRNVWLCKSCRYTWVID